MSSRDYYKSSSTRDRHALPPIRDVLGDQLDRPPHHDATYSFDAVHRALPSTSTQPQSRSRSTWPQTTGPTLPPIYHSHAHGYASAGPTAPTHHSSSSHTRSSHSEQQQQQQQPSQPHSAPYSFDVFRPTSAGLVHASSSSRSQGILRSTRADAGKKHAPPPPEDEEDEHEGDAGMKRYSCSHCGKRFSRPSSLKAHEIVHSDERPYECPHPGCGKTFTVPSNMRRHYRNTHEAAGSGDDDDTYHHHPSQEQSSSSSRYFSPSSSSSRAAPSSAQYYSTRR